jgi:hypothetical protein
MLKRGNRRYLRAIWEARTEAPKRKGLDPDVPCRSHRAWQTLYFEPGNRQERALPAIPRDSRYGV